MTFPYPADNALNNGRVSVAFVDDPIAYPPSSAAPYHPDEKFPEFRNGECSVTSNKVFRAVRETLIYLGLDLEHFNTPLWNPFGSLVQPGARIVVKPNWVLHRNHGSGGMKCMVTHPSVLRAILDYLYLAKPHRVIIADAPLQECDFNLLKEQEGLPEVVRYFQLRGLPLIMKDWRRTILDRGRLLFGVSEGCRTNEDYIEVDLRKASRLEAISSDSGRFRVAMYDHRLMNQHHAPGHHRYLVARDALEADLVVNVPKLKTHKKTGITCCLKNLIGINGNKEYLPHHRCGALADGKGDNYPDFSWPLRIAEEVADYVNRYRKYGLGYAAGIRLSWFFEKLDRKLGGSGQADGSWYGNDTIWRTCLDLNALLLYVRADGSFSDIPVRRVLSIVDGIIAGEREGPLEPEPLPLGAIIAAYSPAAGDWIASKLLGFDPRKIPIVKHAFEEARYPIATYKSKDIKVYSTSGSESVSEDEYIPGRIVNAHPPRGWKGWIEDL